MERTSNLARRILRGLLAATPILALAAPARAQYICDDPGWTVNCNDGTCCKDGSSCIGNNQCSYGDPHSGGDRGGTCDPSFPVYCEAVNVCCGEGSTCGEEGCCQDLHVDGCTSSRTCTGEPNAYVVVDDTRFECQGDDCQAIAQKVADFCASQKEEDDGGCATAPAGTDGAPVGVACAVGLLAGAGLLSRRRRLARTLR